LRPYVDNLWRRSFPVQLGAEPLDWLKEGRKQLDAAGEALHYLCQPVPQPREIEQFLHYFCGNASNPHALNETEALRITFYKAVATFVRAYADIAQNLAEAGYSASEGSALKKEVEFYGVLLPEPLY
jgi:type I restriction enzyme R subunit